MNVRNVSEAGRRFITAHEGRRLQTYPDVAGRPTIGVGHLCRSFNEFPHGITEEECERLFIADLQWVCAEVSAAAHRGLTQTQFDAVADFVFNIGAPRFQNSQVASSLKQRPDVAPIFFFRWTKAGGIRNKALLARRHACAKLYWFADYTPGY